MPAPLNRRMLRFGLTVALVLAALHTYIGGRLLAALPLGAWGRTAVAAALACSALLIPTGMLARFAVRDLRLADRLTWVGSVLMGLFSSLLVLTVLRDLTLAWWAGPRTGRSSALLVPLVAAAVTAIGFIKARRLPRVLEVEVPLAGLPEPWHGFTIVQLSDLHVGASLKRPFVEAVVSRVNRLEPGLIAITGDLVDGSVPQLAWHTAPLAGLKARHGVFVVTGNHEYYSGAPAWVAEFGRLGLRVLNNEHVLLDQGGAPLLLAGVTDFSAELFDPGQRSDPARALAGAPTEALRILLAHQPRSAPAAAAAGFDLQLSGHTHGGQFWPWNLFVWMQQPFVAGLHRLGRLQVYTSRGTGYWGPPNRFGVPSEITLLRLVSPGAGT